MGNKEKGQAEKSMRDAQSRLPAMVKELDEKNEKLAETSAACRQVIDFIDFCISQYEQFSSYISHPGFF